MADHNETQKKLRFAILEYLKSQIVAGDEDASESLNVAIDCLSTVFQLNVNDPQQTKELSISPATLEAVFSVGYRQVSAAVQGVKSAHESQKQGEPAGFQKPVLSPEDAALEQHLKSKGVFKQVVEGSKEYYEILEKAKAKLQSRSVPVQQEESLESKTRRAEEFKVKGNEKINEKKYEEAVALYTEAIALVPTHIYYGNRAAAFFQLKKYNEAISDCNESIRLNATYAKAYYRLGQAYSQLGQHENALTKGYEIAAKLEPSNESYKEVVEETKQRLRPQRPAAAPGGAPDLASLLSNPAIMNMASQVMSNPAMMNSVLGMFGGQGGAPPASPTAPPQAAPTETAEPPLSPDVADLLGNMAANPAVQNLQNNPRMRQIAEEMQREGPMAMLRYMNDPEVMGAIGSIMGSFPGGTPGGQ